MSFRIATTSRCIRSLSANNAPPTSRARTHARFFSHRSHACSSPTLPRILDADLWKSILPKRRPDDDQRHAPDTQHGSAPPTDRGYFYIMIALLIGSQSIHQLMLETHLEDFRRSSDAKLKVLKDLVERLRKGEDIDVKKLLGTGDEEKEREWEEVLREIEKEDSVWKAQKDAQKPNSQPDSGASAPSSSSPSSSSTSDDKVSSEPSPPARFF